MFVKHCPHHISVPLKSLSWFPIASVTRQFVIQIGIPLRVKELWLITLRQQDYPGWMEKYGHSTHWHKRSMMLFFFFLIFLDFPGGSEVKVSACNPGNLGLIPGSGRSPGEGNGNPLQYSCLENPMDRGVWEVTVHGVTKSWTWLNDFTLSLFILIGG